MGVFRNVVQTAQWGLFIREGFVTRTFQDLRSHSEGREGGAKNPEGHSYKTFT
jgi:hypothetical protein